MKTAFAALICTLLFALNADASMQQNKVDSLKKVLAQTLHHAASVTDTSTISQIDKLAEAYFESNPDSSKYYGELTIALSKKIGYQRGIANGLLQVSFVNTFNGDYESSQKNINAAKAIYSKLDYQKGIGDCYEELGRVYDFLGDYSRALETFSLALRAFTKAKSERGLADVYSCMGITYDNKGQFTTALDYYFKSLYLDIKHNDKLAAADNYLNIGVVMQTLEMYPKALNYYNQALKLWLKLNDRQGVSTAHLNIGEVLLAQHKYEEAYTYFQKASTVFHELNDKEGISLVYYDLGLYYADQKDLKNALFYLTKSLSSAEKYQIKYNKANAYLGFARVYNCEKEYAKAREYALLAKITADKLGSLSIKANAALEASKALGGLKRYDEAYHQQDEYIALKDSLKNEESVQKLTSYNIELEFLKKERQLNRQQQQIEVKYKEKIERQYWINVTLAIIVIAMVIALYIYYKARLRQNKINARLEKQNRLIKLQKNGLDEQTKKLHDSNTLKDRLISILAHDLRAPLSTLRGLLHLLHDDSLTQTEFVTMVPQVFKKLEHTSDFLDTLLFWINSQMENFDCDARPFLVKPLFDKVIAHLTDQVGDKHLKLELNIEEGVSISADPNSIEIVIRNLLTNAIKFSKANDTIRLSAEKGADGQVLMSIADGGVGIQADQLEKLFKSKVTSQPGTNNEMGTGLGLLFCKDLIEKCKGKIWVKSEAGMGTTFFFTLPSAS